MFPSGPPLDNNIQILLQFLHLIGCETIQSEEQSGAAGQISQWGELSSEKEGVGQETDTAV